MRQICFVPYFNEYAFSRSQFLNIGQNGIVSKTCIYFMTIYASRDRNKLGALGPFSGGGDSAAVKTKCCKGSISRATEANLAESNLICGYKAFLNPRLIIRPCRVYRRGQQMKRRS